MYYPMRRVEGHSLDEYKPIVNFICLLSYFCCFSVVACISFCKSLRHKMDKAYNNTCLRAASKLSICVPVREVCLRPMRLLYVVEVFWWIPPSL